MRQQCICQEKREIIFGVLILRWIHQHDVLRLKIDTVLVLTML